MSGALGSANRALWYPSSDNSLARLAKSCAEAYTGSGVIGAYAQLGECQRLSPCRKPGSSSNTECLSTRRSWSPLRKRPSSSSSRDIRDSATSSTSNAGRELFALCRRHRLERLGPPLIDYTAEETRIWREVSPKLDELHVRHACGIYLAAKRDLAITQCEIPQLRTLSERVQRETNMHLVPAEGALPYRTFYQYIGARGFPVTQFIRHGSHPEFTPEPDMIHDCLGHVPPLMNHDYAELLSLIGKAVSATGSGEQVLALKRFSWFSIEFGLIEDAGETRVFGAGILSSTGEIPYSVLSPDVRRERFVTDTVINTDYDPSRMQDHLFIAPSLAVPPERARDAGTQGIRYRPRSVAGPDLLPTVSQNTMEPVIILGPG